MTTVGNAIQRFLLVVVVVPYAVSDTTLLRFIRVVYTEMSQQLESAEGRAKNARNQLDSMLIARRKGRNIEEESIEYALEQINEALDAIDEAND